MRLRDGSSDSKRGRGLFYLQRHNHRFNPIRSRNTDGTDFQRAKPRRHDSNQTDEALRSSSSFKFSSATGIAPEGRTNSITQSHNQIWLGFDLASSRGAAGTPQWKGFSASSGSPVSTHVQQSVVQKSGHKWGGFGLPAPLAAKGCGGFSGPPESVPGAHSITAQSTVAPENRQERDGSNSAPSAATIRTQRWNGFGNTFGSPVPPQLSAQLVATQKSGLTWLGFGSPASVATKRDGASSRPPEPENNQPWDGFSSAPSATAIGTQQWNGFGGSPNPVTQESSAVHLPATQKTSLTWHGFDVVTPPAAAIRQWHGFNISCRSPSPKGFQHSTNRAIPTYTAPTAPPESVPSFQQRSATFITSSTGTSQSATWKGFGSAYPRQSWAGFGSSITQQSSLGGFDQPLGIGRNWYPVLNPGSRNAHGPSTSNSDGSRVYNEPPIFSRTEDSDKYLASLKF